MKPPRLALASVVLFLAAVVSSQPPASSQRHNSGYGIARREGGLHLFYNIFSTRDKAGAQRIIAEQLGTLRNSTAFWSALTALHFTTIGEAPSIRDDVERHCRDMGIRRCVHLGHVDSGMEETTLQPLHTFCRQKKAAAVAYIHNKGSFHDHPKQAPLRKFLIGGVASSACVRAMMDDEGSCDTCSSRFCPIPHTHVSGNMFMARCEYVSKLIPPRAFPVAMGRYTHSLRPRCSHKDFHTMMSEPWNTGLKRYSLEHWLGSHPHIRPCDTVDNERFCFGLFNIPAVNASEHSLQPAPRYAPAVVDRWERALKPYIPMGGAGFLRWNLCSEGILERHMHEWRVLYNATPPESSRLLRFFRGASALPPVAEGSGPRKPTEAEWRSRFITGGGGGDGGGGAFSKKAPPFHRHRPQQRRQQRQGFPTRPGARGSGSGSGSSVIAAADRAAAAES